MKNKFAAFFYQLKKHPHLTKEEAVYNFTGGRTNSVKELADVELLELTARLGGGRTYTPPKNHPQPDKRKMIGKLLYYCHQMGWTKTNPQGKTVADVAALNRWMLEKAYLKKSIDAYTFAELPKLVSQFETFYKWWLNNKKN